MGLKEPFYVDMMATQPGVTGSCTWLDVKYPNGTTTKFIVDCGLFQEREYEEYNKSLPFNEDEIDFCLVTHNHIDHTGRLPFLVKNNFKGKIYLSKETSKLLPLALYDSYGALKDIAKRKHIPPLYGEQNVSEAIGLLCPCIFEEVVYIDKNIKATFFQNGHIPGAAIILVQISYPEHEDINLLFTGDYNNQNKFFDVNELPQWVKDLPISIVQESTYGKTESWQKEECFERNILNCIERGGTAVCPAYSLGRFQEVLYKIKTMQDEGKLDSEIPIYADGKLGINYTNLFLKGEIGIKEEMQDFLPKHLTFLYKDTRPSVLGTTSSKIIITTSGSGNYGPAQLYIPEYITNPNALIQFTGYTPEGTLGASLKETEKGDVVTVGGRVLIKRADVEYATEFSAHATADIMIKFLKEFNNLKLVLVNHGEMDTKNHFAERITREVEPKSVVVLGRDYFFRVGSYGLIRSLSTKFK